MIEERQFIEDLKALLGTDRNIGMDTDLLDIDEWDSFSSVSFIAMAEEKYKIIVEPFSVAEAVLVEDLYRIISNG